jgi:hypothetical protein
VEDEAALRCGKPLQPLSKNTPAAISHAPPINQISWARAYFRQIKPLLTKTLNLRVL